MRVMKGIGLLAIPVVALMMAGEAQSQDWPGKGRPAEGATLYEACTPCHTLKGNGIAGKPEAELMSKMKHYQTGTFENSKVKVMQNVMKGMSDQQLLDLSAYITKM